MEELTEAHALKKSALFGNWCGRYQDSKVLEQKCPKCGAKILCVYADMGSTDYYDTFAHICLNPSCDYVIDDQRFECNIGGRSTPDLVCCIFCGRDLDFTS